MHCQSVNSTECSVKSRWNLQPKCSKREGSHRSRSVNLVNITPQWSNIICIITTRKRSYRKVMFSFVCVCLFKGAFMRALPMMLWASPYRDPPALALAPDPPYPRHGPHLTGTPSLARPRHGT